MYRSSRNDCRSLEEQLSQLACLAIDQELNLSNIRDLDVKVILDIANFNGLFEAADCVAKQENPADISQLFGN